ncbi:rhamnogalacturonan acetylesterase [Abyssalbus ytuae]|uniref:Rhamnogalacturonan acetylesterase n=1 Tax=Abyssalbus ytuae TaxID=2926907 RepID=A0A9E7A112_9FLAO|nr:rhamnogalacturonan acetylesterase [Abyssalbus ytuae]UOB17781.1 rhamnogalacturonan acetylesterase [Abyssalbus ytuae]
MIVLKKKVTFLILSFFLLFNIKVNAQNRAVVNTEISLHQNVSFYPYQPRIFYFGNEIKSSKGINITSAIIYDSITGYGFDFNTSRNVTFNHQSFTANAPVYFSVKILEGNYEIELVLGSEDHISNTTVKAESRRLMLREVEVTKNKTIKKVITVNVRTPHINKENQIKINDREKNYLNWDDKLTFEFSGTAAIQKIKIIPRPDITTIFLAGDSTVTDQDLEPWAAWGQLITQYFNTSVAIANYAESGASLSSFKAQKRLEKIISLMKPNDYLFIEFGHNDEKRKGQGIGPWQSYTNLLIEFITKTRKKGGIPVLVTPIQRRFFDSNGKLKPTHGDYPDAMRTVAKKLDVPLIDLTKITTTLYESWGDETSKKAFVQYPANTFPGQDKKLEDNTHFNYFGANEIALCVIKGIQNYHLDIEKYVKTDIPSYDPNFPNSNTNWTVPISYYRFENSQPEGD